MLNSTAVEVVALVHSDLENGTGLASGGVVVSVAVDTRKLGRLLSHHQNYPGELWCVYTYQTDRKSPDSQICMHTVVSTDHPCSICEYEEDAPRPVMSPKGGTYVDPTDFLGSPAVSAPVLITTARSLIA